MTPVLFLPDSLLYASNNITAFFSTYNSYTFPHKDHFYAQRVPGGYNVSFKGKSNLEDGATRELLNRLVGLMTNGFVYHTLKNGQTIGSFVHSIMYWLSYDADSHSLSVVNAPNFFSLSNTFLLEDGEPWVYRHLYLKQMHASLLVESPRPLNDEQVKCVISFFAESLQHHFKYFPPHHLCEPYNFTMNIQEYLDFDADSLKLIIRSVPTDKPYSATLRDETCDQLLCKKDISGALQMLESKGTLMDFSLEKVSIDPAMQDLSCKVHVNDDGESDFIIGLYACSDNLIYKTDIGEDSFPLKLSNKHCYLPKWDDLSPELQKDPDLHFIKHHADLLHLLPQSYIARWLLEAPLDTLNAANAVLLHKIHSGEPYTLPGSRELICTMEGVLGRLLGVNENSSSDTELLTVVDRKTLHFLDEAAVTMKDDVRSKVEALYKCAYLLTTENANVRVHDILDQYFDLSFPAGKLGAYAPEESLYFMVCTLWLISSIYQESGCYENSDETERMMTLVKEGFSIYPSLMFNSSMLFLAMLQKHIDIEHFNRTNCLPLSLQGLSFHIDNCHDGTNMLPIFLYLHDIVAHPPDVNSLVERPFKLPLIASRLRFTHCFESIKNYIAKNVQRMSYHYGAFALQDFLKLFELQFFMLTHESAEDQIDNLTTQTRERLLSLNFKHTYLEKLNLLFHYDKDAQQKLNLFDKYDDIPDALKAMLPINGQSAFPYFAISLLLDELVHFVRSSEEEGVTFNPQVCFDAWLRHLTQQQACIAALVYKWDELQANAILPESFSAINARKERENLLMSPHVQEKLHYGVVDFDILS